MKCLNCNSEKVVKNGKNKEGEQKYLCNDCSSVFSLKAKHRWLSDFEKKLIKQFDKDGMSMNKIAKEIHRNYRTVYNFLNK